MAKWQKNLNEMDLLKKLTVVLVSALMAGCAGTGGFVQSSEAEGKPVAVTVLYPGAANNAGGVGVSMDFTNTSGRTLKYMEFGLVPFNAVGDVVTSSINGKALEIVQYTGPYQPGVSTDDFSVTFSGGPVGFRNVWYNESIRCVEIQFAKAVFMDGTTQVLKGAAATQLVAPSVRKNCATGSS